MGFEQHFPGGADSIGNTDVLRFKIYAYEILAQNLSANNPNHFERGNLLYWWNLVAPTDLQENITHNYEEYHSWQGRGAQLKSDVITATQRLAQGPTRAGGSTKPALNKVDSPMVWTGSERKEYSFTFTFAWYKGATPQAEVFDPIHNFRVLSSASLTGNIDTVHAPAIFEIETYPVSIIKIDNAALTNVQVVYNAPFVRGYPARAELTLTFKDLRPLYSQLWTNDDKVTASEE